MVLQLEVNQGAQRHPIQVSYEDLDRLDFQEIPGCVYLKKSAKQEIIKQIRLNVGTMLQQSAQIGRLYTQSGWYEHAAEKVYVAGTEIISRTEISLPNNALIANNVAQLRLASDKTLSASQAVEALIREINVYMRYAIPTYAYSLYAMFRSLWSEAALPTACVLNLVGTQGYGKTTLARNYCALYDNSSGQIADFFDAQSTPASMRRALADARDRVVVVDDLCRSSSTREVQKRRDLAASLIRNAANETPVAKLCGKTTATSTCSSGLVLTGEIPLQVPSDITRCLIINVDQPLRNGNPNVRTFTATATAHYIQWLCAHFPEELEHLKAAYRVFCDHDTSKSLWRLKKSIFQLDWVWESFLRFAEECAAINGNVHQKLGTAASKIFQSIFTAEEAQVRRLENANPSLWANLIANGAHTHAFPYTTRPGCICVIPSDLTAFLRTAVCNPALQEREVISALKTQGLLLMDKSGKSTKKVSGVRMLHIRITT